MGHTEAELETRARQVLARTFGLTEAQARGPLAMHALPAWDSLGHMQLVAALEAEFGLRLPDYAVGEMTDVASVVQVLVRELGP